MQATEFVDFHPPSNVDPPISTVETALGFKIPCTHVRLEHPEVELHGLEHREVAFRVRGFGNTVSPIGLSLVALAFVFVTMAMLSCSLRLQKLWGLGPFSAGTDAVWRRLASDDDQSVHEDAVARMCAHLMGNENNENSSSFSGTSGLDRGSERQHAAPAARHSGPWEVLGESDIVSDSALQDHVIYHNLDVALPIFDTTTSVPNTLWGYNVEDLSVVQQRVPVVLPSDVSLPAPLSNDPVPPSTIVSATILVSDSKTVGGKATQVLERQQAYALPYGNVAAGGELTSDQGSFYTGVQTPPTIMEHPLQPAKKYVKVDESHDTAKIQTFAVASRTPPCQPTTQRAEGHFGTDSLKLPGPCVKAAFFNREITQKATASSSEGTVGDFSSVDPAFGEKSDKGWHSHELQRTVDADKAEPPEDAAYQHPLYRVPLVTADFKVRPLCPNLFVAPNPSLATRMAKIVTNILSQPTLDLKSFYRLSHCVQSMLSHLVVKENVPVFASPLEGVRHLARSILVCDALYVIRICLPDWVPDSIWRTVVENIPMDYAPVYGMCRSTPQSDTIRLFIVLLESYKHGKRPHPLLLVRVKDMIRKGIYTGLVDWVFVEKHICSECLAILQRFK